MNKITAINVLLKHAQKYSDPNYKADVQALTAACLFMETYLKKNKKDAKVEIKGLEFKLTKGV
tara:strand:+ start:170 stop:358 length:189 start_codon:yes stop_codon:yes gene_type:complete